MESSYTFTFLRHGESVGNAEERFQGQSDFPLTEAGRIQARSLAKRWSMEQTKFDLALTSPLIRAKETAEIITSKLKVPLELDPIWMERDNGAMSGLTRDEIVRRFPEPDFRTPYDPFGESGEGDWELFLRAGRAIYELLKRPPGKYLIVTHGGLLNKVMYAVLGIPVQANSNGPSFRFNNTGFAIFNYVPSRHQWRLIRLESPI
ncbi:MAG: histidine phosphatase family protein [Chloroflexi bacterium]|nr:histidine phosphatase family protein [Chloroflexota bacterium]MCL5612348.1 histidine phosphatase family protein [Chloroflexota bacterium]